MLVVGAFVRGVVGLGEWWEFVLCGWERREKMEDPTVVVGVVYYYDYYYTAWCLVSGLGGRKKVRLLESRADVARVLVLQWPAQTDGILHRR